MSKQDPSLDEESIDVEAWKHGLPDKFPDFKKPSLISSFSIRPNREVELGDGNKKQLNSNLCKIFQRKDAILSVPEMDLRRGFEAYDSNRTEESNEYLKWLELERNRDATDDATKRKVGSSYDFITWRGVMTRIASTPYEKQDGWIIYARRVANSVLLCETKTQKGIEREASMDEHGRLMCYGGHKFETFCCSKSGLSTDPEPEVTGDQWCSVFESKLDGLSILFGAEIDCENPQNEEFIELKTTASWLKDHQRVSFYRFKSMKWWLQSFLIGMDSVIAGFRNKDCVVRELRLFSVKQLHRDARQVLGDRCWKPDMCFNFLHKFLQHVKETATDSNFLYVFEFDPEKRKVFMRTEIPERSQVFNDFFGSVNVDSLIS